jgi:hypothetical protein
VMSVSLEITFHRRASAVTAAQPRHALKCGNLKQNIHTNSQETAWNSTTRRA